MPYRDLREFIARLERENRVHRVQREVDWNLELAHVAKLNEQQEGPALLFEEIKDYPGMSVLTSAFTSRERVALGLDMPAETRFLDIARGWVQRISNKRIPPRIVSTAPCKDHVLTGDRANLLSLPSPWFYPNDGGRYIGTASFLVNRNLETGRLNLGTYRVMVIDEKTAGIQLIKGKDAEIDLRDYAERKQPMPVALVIGGDPVLFLCSSTLFPYTESEYEVAGALRDEPEEVVQAETSDLLVPATAEIVIEGEIVPGELLPEGPFGEYPGYYTGAGAVDREYIRVKCITHRANPILWSTTVGKPVTDTHMIMGINRTASLWNDLQNMKIQGIRGVYGPPAAAGRMLAVISVKQMYHGHSTQVGLAAFATNTGNYGLKTVIVVDDDIDPENMDQVMYALAFRYQPDRGTQILERGRSTPLDPSLPIEQRYMTSRVILDTCIPYEWPDKPIPITMDDAMVQLVKSRWESYFANGRIPKTAAEPVLAAR
ncbi:MAG: UbiD family decarboxylase [Chloroflexota bacterium]|nr:UbiD family decarboxylase [Chloroflexota bacterium]